jgi:hypothetical protein
MPAAGFGSRPGGSEQQCSCDTEGENDQSGACSRDRGPGIVDNGVDAVLGVRSGEPGCIKVRPQ